MDTTTASAGMMRRRHKRTLEAVGSLERDVVGDALNGVVDVVNGVAHVGGDVLLKTTPALGQLGIKRDAGKVVEAVINLPPAIVYDVVHVAGDAAEIAASDAAGLGLKRDVGAAVGDAVNLPVAAVNNVGHVAGDAVRIVASVVGGLGLRDDDVQASELAERGLISGVLNGVGDLVGGLLGGHKQQPQPQPQPSPHPAPQPSPQPAPPSNNGGNNNADTARTSASNSNAGGTGANSSSSPGSEGAVAAQNDHDSASTSIASDAQRAADLNGASQTISFTDANGSLQTSIVAAPTSTGLPDGNGGHTTPSVVDANSPDPGKSDGSKIGVPIGIVAALIAGALLVFIVMRRRRSAVKERRASHYPGYTIAGSRNAKGLSGESWLRRPTTTYYGAADGTDDNAAQDPFHDEAEEPHMRERHHARLSMAPSYSDEVRSISPPAMAAGISNNAAAKFYNLPSAQAGSRMSGTDAYQTAESRETHMSINSEAETSHAHSVGLNHYMQEMEDNLAGHGNGTAAAGTFGAKTSSAASHSNYSADRSSQTTSSQHASLSSVGGVARYISREEFRARHRKQASSTNRTEYMYYDGSVTKNNGYQSRQPGMDAAGAAVSASKSFSPYEELQRGIRVARYSTGSDPFHDATSDIDSGPFRDSVGSDTQPQLKHAVEDPPRRNTKVKFEKDSIGERSAPPSVVVVDHDAESIDEYAQHGEDLLSGQADPFGNDNRRSQHARSGHERDSRASSQYAS
ncbi:hypothetical protein CBOM_05048 [Ceraceosorus bombacis]|uniref:Uncharacterized protein n=1 Tax=Ceraceosorus bombacis TaxID=401625 RepID=A0A0P1BHK8_9BASI|nr:hypothetical protein CBOM_05048 [Ceraceosorus bombacis]